MVNNPLPIVLPSHPRLKLSFYVRPQLNRGTTNQLPGLRFLVYTLISKGVAKSITDVTLQTIVRVLSILLIVQASRRSIMALPILPHGLEYRSVLSLPVFRVSLPPFFMALSRTHSSFGFMFRVRSTGSVQSFEKGRMSSPPVYQPSTEIRISFILLLNRLRPSPRRQIRILLRHQVLPSKYLSRLTHPMISFQQGV